MGALEEMTSLIDDLSKATFTVWAQSTLVYFLVSESDQLKPRSPLLSISGWNRQSHTKLIENCFLYWHFSCGVAVSTVTSQGSWFESRLEPFCVEFACCPKTCTSGVSVSVRGCLSRLSLCGPVMDWWPAQGVRCLSPNDSWERLPPTHTQWYAPLEILSRLETLQLCF